MSSYLLASLDVLSVAAALAEYGQQEPLQCVELCGSSNRRGRWVGMAKALSTRERGWPREGKRKYRRHTGRVFLQFSSLPRCPFPASVLHFPTSSCSTHILFPKDKRKRALTCARPGPKLIEKPKPGVAEVHTLPSKLLLALN